MTKIRSLMTLFLPIAVLGVFIQAQVIAPIRDRLNLHQESLERAVELNAGLRVRAGATQVSQGAPALPESVTWQAAEGRSASEEFQMRLVDRLDGLGFQVERFRLDRDHITEDLTVGYISVEAQSTLKAVAELLAAADAAQPQFSVPTITIRAMPEHTQLDGQTMVTTSFRIMAFLEDGA